MRKSYVDVWDNSWVIIIFTWRLRVLWSQDLKVGQEKEPCIEFTQENSIESSIQTSLPYIPN